MTLSRSMVYKITGITLSIVLLGAASLWGLFGMRDDLRLAHDEYIELGMLRKVSIHAAGARGLLQARELDMSRMVAALDKAITGIEDFIAYQRHQVHGDKQSAQQELAVGTTVRGDLVDTRDFLSVKSPPSTAVEWDQAIAPLDRALQSLGSLADEMDRNIAQAQNASTARLRDTVLLTAILSAGGIILTILINVSQYRAVITPLGRLREGVRRLAGGNLQQPIVVRGAAEFAELSADFNQMARELASLYCDLERKVVAKSRELVRSERLASVGYLAAGVAHEINNPLNIITGHAELSLRKTESITGGWAAEITEALQIIREEGFRCKSITEKLLALAQTSNGGRETVEIGHVVRDVVSLVEGLKQFRERQVRLELVPEDSLLVWGNESELKQVLLNLVINALQAVADGTGQVVIAGRRHHGTIQLTVSDNGRGIAPAGLDRVFEPFFSEACPGIERGTGLGLSITHAIIEAHGGRIQVESPGPGLGSRFTIQLPGCAQNVNDGKAA